MAVPTGAAVSRTADRAASTEDSAAAGVRDCSRVYDTAGNGP
ncbi:hypothetical protein SAMN05421678_10848 [Actinopolymorpha cephalotaxi]|uniref:Uncharacterized protein n=1 Tax=Actinopolymorpha cephalotaxi TaxID=504797 RepID=A0A1I2U6W3_9ACTN|nr:hypothetical protein SAMN05421678_10848 [Actinopolymorpha cephalotaxi]